MKNTQINVRMSKDELEHFKQQLIEYNKNRNDKMNFSDLVRISINKFFDGNRK